MSKRVESLDYLRGIMAFSVLVYHFFVWENIQPVYPFDNLISRLGVYAVGAFYVLSGASLGLVYLDKEIDKVFLKTFVKKRILRIAPLFYLATTMALLITILMAYKNGDFSNVPNLQKILLNFSLTFGWLDHDNYIATGAWSIGNELVFYSLLPLMLLLTKKSGRHFIAFFSFTVVLTGFFSYFLLNSEMKLEEQWSTYINPLNQIYLFTGGLLISWLYKTKKVKVSQVKIKILMAISVLVFILLPVGGMNHIGYVTGYAKVLLSLAIFGMSFSAMFLKQPKDNYLTKVLKYFGDISYSIYLLHPIAYAVCNETLGVLGVSNSIAIIFMSAIAAFVMSSISYKFLEQPFMRLGRKKVRNTVLSKAS